MQKEREKTKREKGVREKQEIRKEGEKNKKCKRCINRERGARVARVMQEVR